jgi:hypothetical protein
MLSRLSPTIVPIYYLFIIHSATSCLVECVNNPIVKYIIQRFLLVPEQVPDLAHRKRTMLNFSARCFMHSETLAPTQQLADPTQTCSFATATCIIIITIRAPQYACRYFCYLSKHPSLYPPFSLCSCLLDSLDRILLGQD